MNRDVQGIMACVIAPIVATALSPILLMGVWIFKEIRIGSPGIKPWYLRELVEAYQGVAVIILPVMLISYLLFHFILRPHIAGHFKNPRRTLALTLAGGGILAFLFLIVMIAIGVTCSQDRWVDTHFLSDLLRPKTDNLLALSVPVIASIVLGFLAWIFLPRNTLPGDTHPTGRPIGKRLILSALTLVFMLYAIGGVLFFYWKRGSDRAGCILNIRNVQQAMRAYQGMNSSEAAPKEKLIGPGMFMETEPVCPRGGKYTWSQPGWQSGKLMIECSCEGHVPSDYRDW